MQISLFVPCFVDAFYPQAGLSAARVLQRLGHEVSFHEKITCCGQPAFNSGYWDEARQVATPALRALRKSEVVVIVSGSCGAMLKVFYPQIFAGTKYEAESRALGEKTWEFSDFLVSKLGVEDVGAHFAHTVTWHDGCHGLRELNIQTQPRKLLANVRGLELIEMNDTQTCCGFGGTFAAKFGEISTAMGEVKAEAATATGAEFIVSNDSSCLMHIQGLLDRQGNKLKSLHLAEVLASSE